MYFTGPNAEKFSKRLSLDDKMKYLIPVQYFIGEDLIKPCYEAKWEFNIRRYFQSFFEACRKKVESCYLKEKRIWDLH
ncbi:hypothetical protein GCM10022218_17040 [Sphingobacterium ginsenosidimutans]|uniref:Uncharacterized protein n=1 Tax=Sphingobacterium ginsenosidimutans TaxID=687845 RepID=A0ABP7ZYR2_9SPHI